jgi:hypothetical protein
MIAAEISGWGWEYALRTFWAAGLLSEKVFTCCSCVAIGMHGPARMFWANLTTFLL